MLNRFDSGMADLTTCNAVTFALKRELEPDAEVRVTSDSMHCGFFCSYNGKEYPLPGEVSDWLQLFFHGIPGAPMKFEITLETETQMATLEPPKVEDPCAA